MMVAKRHKRLVVLDGERVAYTPPTFLRNFMRTDLQPVADAACALAVIVAFEDRFNPRGRRRP